MESDKHEHKHGHPHPAGRPSTFKFGLPMVFWLTALIASSVAAFGINGLFFAFLAAFGWFLYLSGWNWAWIEVLVCLGIGVVVISLALPAVRSAPPASIRTQCINNEKQIMLGLLNYESANGHFPPPYLADENGKPIHSWRVLILPYTEHGSLYERYDFDEPWDGPNNSKLIAEMPNFYGCPAHSDGLCRYRADCR